ncbi:hypothetical protein NL676_027745 [Syzygium grande]|nr:hypothetical protein NL676_027745 [Syzygium grande]
MEKRKSGRWRSGWPTRWCSRWSSSQPSSSTSSTPSSPPAGSSPPAEIASRVGAKNPGAPVMLDRMMRLLASHGVIEWRARRGDGDGDGGGDGREIEYGAGPMCRFLAKDEVGAAVGPLFLLHHDKVFMESWYNLNDVIMDGGVPFERAYGMTAFE